MDCVVFLGSRQILNTVSVYTLSVTRRIVLQFTPYRF